MILAELVLSEGEHHLHEQTVFFVSTDNFGASSTTDNFSAIGQEIDELAGFEAVVIDPPRAGAEAQTAEIAKARVPNVAFVSCNPTTFARDARILTNAGYKLDWIDVVDQFRWATHVELVARFAT